MTAVGESSSPFPFAFVQDVLLGGGRDVATFTGVSQERGYYVQGAHGNDSLSTDSGSGWSLLGQAGDDSLMGGSGDDYFQTGVGSDTVMAHGGNDRVAVIGRADSSDVYSGGRGLDSIFINGLQRNPVSVSLDGVANDGGPGEQDQILPDFESVATYGGNDVLIGDEDTNMLDAGPGNDTIDGGPGADELRGRSGRDDITGGSGRDALIGGTQRDIFHTTDGELDRIRGGNGHDTATDRDSIDRVHDVEAF
jgi:Ca2+-binding RTX toxin-like protein